VIIAPVITVEEVVRRFRRGSETVVALDGVSLELYGGEFAVAAGPSGSGKTTLLSIMAGLERTDAGRVITHRPLSPSPAPPARCRSRPESQRPRRSRWPRTRRPEGQWHDGLAWRHLAFVPQALALLDELTVAENIDLPARLDPAPGQVPSTEELLELLELDHIAGRYPSHTSGGEQQRTAVARALRLRPPLLLGDEPTGHQDRGRVELLLTVLRQHAYNGAAVLVASHDQEVIAAADRVITLADGQIASDTRTEARSYG
jgi:putative ABC transport system ATP-binding protein